MSIFYSAILLNFKDLYLELQSEACKSRTSCFRLSVIMSVLIDFDLCSKFSDL